MKKANNKYRPARRRKNIFFKTQDIQSFITYLYAYKKIANVIQKEGTIAEQEQRSNSWRKTSGRHKIIGMNALKMKRYGYQPRYYNGKLLEHKNKC